MQNQERIEQEEGETLHEKVVTDFLEGVRQQIEHGICPFCDTHRGQWRGYRARKRGAAVHRRLCNECKKWYFKETIRG